jgi:prephenate dehydratase
VLPVENTLAGAVVGSLDVIGDASLELCVTGEAVIAIRHCVLGLPGARLERLRQIRSHPVALAQCTRFFEATRVEAIASYDTAGAAREVQERSDQSVAAIAGEAAADLYGLEVLARNVADRPDNQTRFLSVVRTGCRPQEAAGGKTLLVAQVSNTPGALVRLLGAFAERGINVSRLDARPGTEPWTHRFFLEVEMDTCASQADAALQSASDCALSLRFLGSFRSSEIEDA